MIRGGREEKQDKKQIWSKKKGDVKIELSQKKRWGWIWRIYREDFHIKTSEIFAH